MSLRKDFSIIAKDASSLAKASLIAKIRAKVSNFPVIKASVMPFMTHAIAKSLFLLDRCL